MPRSVLGVFLARKRVFLLNHFSCCFTATVFLRGDTRTFKSSGGEGLFTVCLLVFKKAAWTVVLKFMTSVYLMAAEVQQPLLSQ